MNVPDISKIAKYVSNIDKNVYTIFNLPEEVIAVIFAYVSRSPASFRENLAKLLADDDLSVDLESVADQSTTASTRAAKFHEKWVLAYGHSSVAEHACTHIGVEKISRLASAELELATSFNSFTEYSQRYQRPNANDFYIPAALSGNKMMENIYMNLQQESFAVYETLLAELITYIRTELTPEDNESPKMFELRTEKLAFEDARYVLTLATMTSLGMTGNGRSLRDTMVKLLSSRYLECHQLAEAMETEIGKMLPTLVKYVKHSEYSVETRQAISHCLSSVGSKDDLHNVPNARFIKIPDYESCLSDLCKILMVSHKTVSYEEADKIIAGYSSEQKEALITEALQRLTFFDHPLEEFQHITYDIELCISEANWHQVLRHNRRTHFSFGQPTTNFGYVVPPRIKRAGLTEIFTKFMDEADQVHQQIYQWNELVAPYVVTNAHRRPIRATLNLWELYHLINLRTSEHAQWDVQETFLQLHNDLQQIHPLLAKWAKRR